MEFREIILPETKPETEWVGGRALQKVSPTYDHARLQMLLGMALTQWADAGSHGRVGTEWRFRVSPPGEAVRPLVPDIAFLSYDALAADVPRTDVQAPLAAPTVAIEILSPGDRPRDVADKIAVFLSSGSAAVLVFDPAGETVAVHELDAVTSLRAGDVFEHEALPGFRLDLRDIFERARR